MTYFSEDIKLFPIFLAGMLCKIFALLNKLFCLAVIPVTFVFLTQLYPNEYPLFFNHGLDLLNLHYVLDIDCVLHVSSLLFTPLM